MAEVREGGGGSERLDAPRTGRPGGAARRHYGLAVAAVAAAWAVAEALQRLIGDPELTALLLAAVAGTAWWTGRGPGLAAVAAAMLVRFEVTRAAGFAPPGGGGGGGRRA